MEARLGRERLVHNHAIFGINDTGAMIKRRVQSFLSRLPDGLTEMYFHPAVKKWSGMTAGYQCEAEYAALIDPDVAQAVRAADIHLTTFAAAAQKHSL